MCVKTKRRQNYGILNCNFHFFEFLFKQFFRKKLHAPEVFPWRASILIKVFTQANTFTVCANANRAAQKNKLQFASCLSAEWKTTIFLQACFPQNLNEWQEQWQRNTLLYHTEKNSPENFCKRSSLGGPPGCLIWGAVMLFSLWSCQEIDTDSTQSKPASVVSSWDFLN